MKIKEMCPLVVKLWLLGKKMNNFGSQKFLCSLNFFVFVNELNTQVEGEALIRIQLCLETAAAAAAAAAAAETSRS